MRPLTPSRSSTAVAETGSVGPSTAPSTNAADHGIPSSAFATAATAAIVTTTSPTASSPIGFQLARSSETLTVIAAAYSSGGRKTKKITSGSTSGDGRPGHEPDHEPAEHQRDRIRHARAQAERGQHDHGEQQEDEELDLGHAII